MAAQGLHPRDCRIVRRLSVGDEFTVTAVAQSGFRCAVPEITASGCGHGENSFGRVDILSAFVVCVCGLEPPHLLHEIARIRPHRPLMPIGADFGIGVKIVEEDKLVG